MEANLNKRKISATDFHPSATESARFMQMKRTNSSTKQNYSSKIRLMTKWLMENSSDDVDSNGMIKLPVSNQSIIQFFGELSKKAAVLLAAKDKDASNLPIPMSVSSIRGYRSALVDLYKTNNLKLDPSLDNELTNTLDGYEKSICELKQRGRLKINEGKRHLKWSGYVLIATKFMTKTPHDSTRGQSWTAIIFGWSFFVITWNLMSRSESVDTLMLQHIDWDGDALIIEEQGHKGDQTGEKKFGKHIYANPTNPDICPILALGILIFCYPDRPDGKQQLFAGTNTKDRFGDLLSRILSSLDSSERQILGCHISDIGTHSLRKGSSTYALGQVSGPTPVSVFLRMGQTLGQLKDRYMHASEGADQLCGRMVAGLPFDNEMFAILPPHFKCDALLKMDEVFWISILSDYPKYPNGLKNALPFFLASVLHHENYLREKLHPSHPLFLSRIFANSTMINELRGITITGIGRCEYTEMRATGIPPHLALSEQLHKIKLQQSELNNSFTVLRHYIDETLPLTVASSVTGRLKENFIIDGIAPLSLRDVDDRLSSLEERIISRINTDCSDKTSQVIGDKLDKVEEWKIFNWGDGRLHHFVPRDWQFPSRLTMKNLWDLWWFGDRGTGIRPYYMINFAVELNGKYRMRHSRAKRMINYCIQIANMLDLVSPSFPMKQMSLMQSDAVFSKIFDQMIEDLYKGKQQPGRPYEIAYGTLYNLVPKQSRKKKSR